MMTPLSGGDFARRDLPLQLELSVIFPVKDEKNNLRILVEEIITAIKPFFAHFEIIGIDDGSTDGSRELLVELAAEYPVLKPIWLRRNYGQSAALDAGFRTATGEIIVTLDADRQNDPADIPRLIDFMLKNELDLVSGERASRQDGFLFRTLPSRIANNLIRRVTGTKIRDLGCSLKVFRREVIEEIHLYGEMHRFVAVLAEGMGAKTAQANVNHRPRTSGKTKYGLTRTFKVLLDLMTVWFMRGFQAKPIYVFGGSAMFLMIGALALSMYVLYQKFFEGVWVHRNPVFIMSMVMAIMAIQFLGMGLMAEMIVRTYFESRGKPPYLVSKIARTQPVAPVVTMYVSSAIAREHSRAAEKAAIQVD